MATSTTLRHYTIRSTGQDIILHTAGCWGEWRHHHCKAWLDKGGISLRGVCVNCGGSHLHPRVTHEPPEQLEMLYPTGDPDAIRRVKAQFYSASQLRDFARNREILDCEDMNKAELITALLEQ